MLITKKIIFTSLIGAIIYVCFVMYVTNTSFVTTIVSGKFPLYFKLKVFGALILGFPTTMNFQNFILVLCNAILTGITASLVLQRLTTLKKTGSLHVVAGGSWLLAVVSGGCVSCGLPLFSLFGLSGALLYLPFKGQEVAYLSCALLCISLVFLLRQRRKDMMCEIIPTQK